MENNILYEPDCLIYPGTYVPLLKEEEVKSALKLSQEGDSILPPVNVLEFPDLFKVEMAIPGVKREDFLVHSDGNDLSISVLHKNPGCDKEERFQLHEFNYSCFDRHIILPGNVDSAYACAEYKDGILRLYLPKSNQPGNNLNTTIAVY